MQYLITNIYKKLSPVDFLDIIGTEEPSEHKENNPEYVTVVYSENIGNSKGYHFYDYGEDRIRYNTEFFKVEDAKEFVFDSITMALVKGTVVYLLFEVSDKCQKFLETVLKKLLPPVIALAEDKRMHNFKAAFSSAIDTKVKEYKENIKDNERDAELKETELLTLRRKLFADMRALEALDGTVGQWKQKAEQEYDHLMKLVPNLYAAIYVKDGELIATTYLVVIRYQRKNYDIGEFEVRINLATGSLSISNQTNAQDDYDHPHISSGTACLGNIGKGIIKMLAEFEIFGALQLIHTYLHSYNDDSPYYKIEHWDPDYVEEETERYERCRDNNSGHDCVNCEYRCNSGRRRIREHEEQESIEEGVET